MEDLSTHIAAYEFRLQMQSVSEYLQSDPILVSMPSLPPAAANVTATANSTCVSMAWAAYDPTLKYVTSVTSGSVRLISCLVIYIV